MREGETIVGGGRGSGGVEQLAGAAQAAASATQLAVGANATTAAAAGDAASQAAQHAMRAATASISTREHLSQTGEYQLQDAMLCEAIEVNEAFVLNAYICFARLTGARPGMAVNVENDSVDPNSAWANCAPLIWEDLLVGTLDDDGGIHTPKKSRALNTWDRTVYGAASAPPARRISTDYLKSTAFAIRGHDVSSPPDFFCSGDN